MKPLIRAVTVCVDYDDLLQITLPSALDLFHEIVIVTVEGDPVATGPHMPQVTVLETFAFYAEGALFNKGAAIEQGFNCLPREGWLAVFDADIVFPEFQLNGLNPAKLYTARRRVLADPRDYREDLDWSQLPYCRDPEPAGYFLLFHASAPVLRRYPWYGTRWRHAGGCDSEFVRKWPKQSWTYLPQDVLHLGQPWVNWAGRVTPRTDTGVLHPDADQRRAILQSILVQRRKTGYLADKL